jgi:hypothetical protein
VQQWLDTPGYLETLLAPGFMHLGFAERVNGQGRKIALAALGVSPLTRLGGPSPRLLSGPCCCGSRRPQAQVPTGLLMNWPVKTVLLGFIVSLSSTAVAITGESGTQRHALLLSFFSPRYEKKRFFDVSPRGAAMR